MDLPQYFFNQSYNLDIHLVLSAIGQCMLGGKRGHRLALFLLQHFHQTHLNKWNNTPPLVECSFDSLWSRYLVFIFDNLLILFFAYFFKLVLKSQCQYQVQIGFHLVHCCYHQALNVPSNHQFTFVTQFGDFGVLDHQLLDFVKYFFDLKHFGFVFFLLLSII